MIKFPQQHEGKTVGGVFSLLDLVPSLLAYLRIDRAAFGLQGDAVNLPALLRCSGKPVVSATIFEFDMLKSVIWDRYKYIQTHSPESRNGARRLAQAEELYDLISDPGEQRNLREEQPRVVRYMAGLLRDRDTRLSASDRQFLQKRLRGRSLPRRQASPFDPVTRQRLRALGYLQ